MLWGKKPEVQEDTVPDQVKMAMKVLELFESRPGTVTTVVRSVTSSGQDFAQATEEKEEYHEAPTELTKEQKDLQGVACLVLNSYLTSHMMEQQQVSEDA